MTPPHNVTLYATDNRLNPEAINCLIDGLTGHDIPGVTTEKTLAEYFAKEYASRMVVGVAYVYTPPYERVKGYATSIVAQLSKFALSKGYKKCVLYTDLANPTSNSIYQKIGYKPICDSLMIKFEKK